MLTVLAMTVLATSQSKLIALQPDVQFPAKGETIVRTFENIDPGMPFDELIPSWNVSNSQSAAMKVQIRVHEQSGISDWYTLGEWSLTPKTYDRTSVKGQKDAMGSVDTDTLTLANPGSTIDAQVTLTSLGDGPRPTLKLLTFCFYRNGDPLPSSNDPSPAWGKLIDVPQRAQGLYPNGGVLCSPTSVSMVLWHYSYQLNRPELNKDVPEVEANVWDTAYKGAGNWPFNTAYAGSFDGLRAYVSRFSSIGDCEKWIDAGYPVVCSVALSLIMGKELSKTEAGHLVVLVGFTKDGDPIFNDPAHKDEVRKVYKRADFEKGWLYSKRTVYLIYPENAKTPANNQGLWIEPAAG